ncbi:NUDIX hydrolase [Longilinea arvoryzae]|nr:NUDIX domain-containing protein [Longilinea arvoryzae]
MVEVQRHAIGTVADEKLAFAVICARHEDQWLFVRHGQRSTWEVPGGHREPGETVEQAAARELFEETGAEEYSLVPVCDYSVQYDGQPPSFGRLFVSRVERLGMLPESEIAEVVCRAEMPAMMTYPQIQPWLQNWAAEYLRQGEIRK